MTWGIAEPVQVRVPATSPIAGAPVTPAETVAEATVSAISEFRIIPAQVTGARSGEAARVEETPGPVNRAVHPASEARVAAAVVVVAAVAAVGGGDKPCES